MLSKALIPLLLVLIAEFLKYAASVNCREDCLALGADVE